MPPAPRWDEVKPHAFFETPGALDIRKFQPKTFLESADVVVTIIELEFVVKATGRAVSEEGEVHIWRFDTQGRVTSSCHEVDTQQHRLALQGPMRSFGRNAIGSFCRQDARRCASLSCSHRLLVTAALPPHFTSYG